MSEVRLDLKNLSVPDKIAFAQTVVVEITGSAGAFPTPVPALSVVTEKAATLLQKFQAATAARLASVSATRDQEDVAAELDALLTQLGNYVQTTSNGNANIIAQAGMGVRSAPTKSTPLDAPVIKQAEMGIASGSVALEWYPLPTARAFVVEHTPDLSGQTGWVNGADFTRRKGTVPGLVPGTRYLFRLAGVNSLGKGPWSASVPQVAAL